LEVCAAVSKILVVDDDQSLAESLKAALTKEGFVVDLAACADDADEMLQGFAYDLVILDWVMPGTEGIEFLGAIRRRGSKARVLMLTGKNDVQNKIDGLDTGADDYVTKPFSRSELISRVRALLRRPQMAETNDLCLAGVQLDQRNFRVTWHGTEIKLTKQEYQVLELLMRNKNEVLSADTIVERAWSSFSESSSDTVRVHLSRLRKKFESDQHECPVRTVHGRGYVFSTDE
jgi:DNA-binding response OmpR family regulator